MKFKIRLAITITFLIFLFAHCKYDNFEARFEAEIYNKAISTDGYVWFKYTNQALKKSLGSGHSSPYLKTRYNAIAANQLDSVGKIKLGAKFPEHSMVVKELLNDKGDVELYAVLYKKSNHPNADTKGWVWGYYNRDGSVRTSSALKGKDCNGCHSQALNEDYMLMNKYYP